MGIVNKQLEFMNAIKEKSSRCHVAILDGEYHMTWLCEQKPHIENTQISKTKFQNTKTTHQRYTNFQDKIPRHIEATH